MRRRDFITLLGGAASAWSTPSRGQPTGRMPHIGIIMRGGDEFVWAEFRRGLVTHGYIEGRNIITEIRKGGDPENFATAADQLARLSVDVIVTWDTAASVAAKRATTTIPIVAIAIGDPVRVGLVASISRPGGNITGNTVLGSDLVVKRLQLLKELIPSFNRLGFLWNPDNDPLHSTYLEKIIGSVDHSGLPGMYQAREPVASGGLISYGPNQLEVFRRGASYVHRILQGAKPAELPIEQPTTVELIINIKTAKALDLTIPQSVLLRADELIE